MLMRKSTKTLVDALKSLRLTDLQRVSSDQPDVDTSVAVWAAQRSADLLERAIGEPIEVVAGG